MTKQTESMMATPPKIVDGLAEFKAMGNMTLWLKPISILDIARARSGTEEKFRDAGEIVDPPKIKIPVVGEKDGGIEQTVTGEIVAELQRQIDTGTLSEALKDSADDVIREFEAYNETMSRLFIETNANTTRVFLRSITNIPEMQDLTDPETGALINRPVWIVERERMGIVDVPEVEEDGDAFERARYWLLNEALVLPSEFIRLQGIITFISSEGAMKWEDVGAAADMFRDSIRGIVEESGGEDSEGD